MVYITEQKCYTLAKYLPKGPGVTDEVDYLLSADERLEKRGDKIDRPMNQYKWMSTGVS